MAEGGSILCCRPLDYRTAKTGGAVNGGTFAPFILTVDRLGWIINLNYSVGKVRWRPWAERGGRIATNTTTFNREILIVEKANDGKPFELHTSYADKEKYYRNLRNPWLFLLLLFALFALIKHSLALGIFSLVSAIPSILYQIQIIVVRQKAKTWE